MKNTDTYSCVEMSGEYDHSNPLFSAVATLENAWHLSFSPSMSTECMIISKIALFPLSPYSTFSFINNNSDKIKVTVFLTLFTLNKLEKLGKLSRRRTSVICEHIISGVSALYKVEASLVSQLLNDYAKELETSIKQKNAKEFINKVISLFCSNDNETSIPFEEMETIFSKFEKFIDPTIDELFPIFEV